MQIKQFDIIFSKNILYVLEVVDQTEDATTVQALCIDDNRLYIFPSKIPNKEYKIIHNNSLKEMLSHLDNSLEENNIEPVICTLLDKNTGHTVICLLHSSIIIIDIDAAKIYKLTSFSDVKSIWAGQSTENFKIIEYYDTVSDALKAPEMFSYQDVLNEI